MILTVEAQLMSIIISIFAGLMIGLLFDLYRTINYFAKPSKAFLHFMDLLFWVLTGCTVFFMLLKADYAELRVYTFIGIIMGLFIYFKLFTEYVLRFYRAIIYVVGKTIRLIFIFITYPVKLVYNLLWNAVNFIGKQVSRFSKLFNKSEKKSN